MRKTKKFATGGSDKYKARYDRKVADIESDYKKAQARKTGRDAEVAKAKYEQRMADAKDDLAKWTGADRTATRAGEKAAEKNLSMTRKFGARSSEGLVNKAEESLASKAPLSSVNTSDASKTKQSFRSAFAAARKAGDKTFTWNDKSYTTKLAGESRPSSVRSRVSAGSSAAKKDTTPVGLSTSGERTARKNYTDIMAKNFAAREKAPKPAAGSTAPRTAPAPVGAPTRNIDRFNLDRVRQEMDKPAQRSRLYGGDAKLKAAQERAAAAQGKAKGGKIDGCAVRGKTKVGRK